MENKRFLNVNDVAEFMGISIPMAYKIIRRLNDELVTAGYITAAGGIRPTLSRRSMAACSPEEVLYACL